MSRSRRLFRTLILLVLPVALSGCLAVAAAGTGSGVGYVATEDRSLQQNADDIVACTQAIQLWAQFNTQLNDDLNCHTYDGRMLVTGNVPSEAWRDEAIARAWRAKNVKQVYNEIAVGSGEGFMSDAHDSVTTQKLKAQLLTDSDVRSNNYIVTTENRVVYILGSAHSDAEKQRVIDRARGLSGVRRVVSYIDVNPTAPPATAGAPAPAAAAAPAVSPASPSVETPPPVSSPPAATSPPAGGSTQHGDITVTPLQ